MDTKKINTIENYCFHCYHYDPLTGVCSQINENVRSYKKKFVAKCNGKFFKNDPNKQVDKVEDIEGIEDIEDIDDNQEKTSNISKDDKGLYHFKTLLGYGKLISATGWFIVFLGIICIVGGIGSGEEIGFAIAGGGLILIIMGIIMVVTGQVISCFVSIEKNTRLTYELLKDKH